MDRKDLPDGLEIAIRAGEVDPDEFERAGYPALRDWINGVTADPPEDLAEWVEARRRLGEESALLAEDLERPHYEAGTFPRWWGCRWHRLLRQPWAEDAEWAVAEARAVEAD
jgi:hypothetical protein